MSLVGKRDNLVRDDLHGFATAAGIKTSRARQVIAAVSDAVRRWREFSEQAGVDTQRASQIARAHRLL